MMQRTKTNKQLTILTNDPSFTAWGWAVISYDGKIINAGCIATKPSQAKNKIRKGDDRIRRTSEICNKLKEIIKKYNVQYILAELPHGSQNAQAAIMLGITAGILQSLSIFTGIGIEWYSEQDSKKCLLGKRSATKDETKNKIKKYYNINWTGIKYIDEAIADSMSIYHVAKQQSPTLKFLKFSSIIK